MSDPLNDHVKEMAGEAEPDAERVQVEYRRPHIPGPWERWWTGRPLGLRLLMFLTFWTVVQPLGWLLFHYLSGDPFPPSWYRAALLGDGVDWILVGAFLLIRRLRGNRFDA